MGAMDLDMLLVFGSLSAIVLSLVWSRATIVGPVMFAWAGAAVGGVWAFVHHYNPAYDRVGIDFIVPSAALGAACGLVPGFVVRSAYLRGGHRRQAVLEAFAASVLAASLGLVIGWISHRRHEDSLTIASVYSGVFAVVGAALALLNGRFRSTRNLGAISHPEIS